jgi:hypothetical protein
MNATLLHKVEQVFNGYELISAFIINHPILRREATIVSRFNSLSLRMESLQFFSHINLESRVPIELADLEPELHFFLELTTHSNE